MVIKCKTCAGQIMYDGESSRLVCSYCGSSYTKYDYASEIEANLQEMQNAKFDEMEISKEEYHVFICSECGAEVLSHKNEVSTFCGFCGQNTIIFSHMAEHKMPDFVIPFKTTREQAIDSIKAEINKGAYIKNELKNFLPEAVVGIYVPYALYSCEYDDLQKRRMPRSETVAVHAQMHMEFVTIDLSSKFNNKAAEWIEPFYFDQAVGFDPTYLIGFFADAPDEKPENIEVRSEHRIRSVFNQEISKKYPGEIVATNPHITDTTEETVLLPVWMMTKKIDGEYHTFMVNGQTGKAIGAVPVDKRKLTCSALLWFVLFASIFVSLFVGLFWYSYYAHIAVTILFVILSIVTLVLLYKVMNNIKEYYECLTIAQDFSNKKMVHSRTGVRK